MPETNIQTSQDVSSPASGRPHTYLYVWIVGFCVLVLIIAISLTAYIFYTSKSIAPIVDEVAVPWTSDDKKEALEEINSTAQRQGVPQLTTEEKFRILENANKAQ